MILSLEADLELVGYRGKVGHRVSRDSAIEVCCTKLKQAENLMPNDFQRNKCVDLLVNGNCIQSIDVEWECSPRRDRDGLEKVDIVNFEHFKIERDSLIEARLRMKAPIVDLLADLLPTYDARVRWLIANFVLLIEIDRISSSLWVKD